MVDNKNGRTREPFVRVQDAIKPNDLPFGVGQDVIGELQDSFGLDGCFQMIRTDRSKRAFQFFDFLEIGL